MRMSSQTVMDGTLQTVFTTPAGKVCMPKTILVCNFSELYPVTFRLYFVPSGGSPGNENIAIADKVVMPKETQAFNFDVFLQAGFTIIAQANIANIANIQVSGVDVA